MARYVVTEADGTTVVGGPYLWDGVTPFTPEEIKSVPSRKLLLETPTRRYVGPGPTVEQRNKDTLESKGKAALNSNATYLALTAPTTAQVTAQVKLLTQECNALIRLQLDLLDTTTGT